MSKSKLEDSVAGARETVQLVRCLVCKDASLHSGHQDPCEMMGKGVGIVAVMVLVGGDRIHESHCQATCPNQGSPATVGGPVSKKKLKSY